jgi:hypothetical protein
VPASLADDQLVDVLLRHLTILQGHPSAELMMQETLTEDFQTGLVADKSGGESMGTAETRLSFFLRSWTPQSRTNQ